MPLEANAVMQMGKEPRAGAKAQDLSIFREAEVSGCHWPLPFHSCLSGINRKSDLQGQRLALSILDTISPLGASPMQLVLRTVHTTADGVLSESLKRSTRGAQAHFEVSRQKFPYSPPLADPVAVLVPLWRLPFHCISVWLPSSWLS